MPVCPGPGIDASIVSTAILHQVSLPATVPQVPKSPTPMAGGRSPPRNVDSGWARRSAIGDAFIVLARLVWMRLRDTGPAARDR